MELPGSGYLYTVATLSMTFAGFCAIVIVLRQSIGKEIAGFHVVLTRLYLESGLWAAAFAMLPALLAICGLPHATACRASSVIIAIVMVTYGATYPARRRAMMVEPYPGLVGCPSQPCPRSSLLAWSVMLLEFQSSRVSALSPSPRLGRWLAGQRYSYWL